MLTIWHVTFATGETYGVAADTAIDARIFAHARRTDEGYPATGITSTVRVGKDRSGQWSAGTVLAY